MKAIKLNNQNGFTIIELLISSAIFSIVLLLSSYAMLQIGRTYYKGVMQTRTQETARSVLDQLSQAVQYGGTVVETADGNTPTTAVFCINDYKYSYSLDRVVVDENPSVERSESYHGLTVGKVPEGGCTLSSTPHDFSQKNITDAREMLAPNMRLGRLDVKSLGNNLYSISIKIIAGPNDALDDTHQQCTNDTASSQFCAISELTATVYKRV